MSRTEEVQVLAVVYEEQVVRIDVLGSPHVEPSGSRQAGQDPVRPGSRFRRRQEHPTEAVRFRRVMEPGVGIEVDDHAIPV